MPYAPDDRLELRIPAPEVERLRANLLVVNGKVESLADALRRAVTREANRLEARRIKASTPV